MMQAARNTRHWWSHRPNRLIALFLTSALLALIGASILGYGWLLAIIIIAPRIAITIAFEPDQRHFPHFVWIVYAVWWLAGTAAFLLLSRVSAEAGGGLLSIFIGNDVTRLIVAILLGLAFALLVVLLPVYNEATIGARWVLAVTRVYGVTRSQSVRLMLYLLLGINQPVWIAEDGELKESEPKGWPKMIGGHGVVVIRPYNAVVFEQAGRVTRIEGPGMVVMNLDERVKEVVDLRPKSQKYEADQVLTRDRVPLKFVGGVGFRVQRLEDMGQHASGFTRLSAQARDAISFRIAGQAPEQGTQDDHRVLYRTVHRAVYGVRTGQRWFEKVPGDVEGEIRKVVRNLDFRDIYDFVGTPGEPENRVEPNRQVLDEIIRTVVEALRRSTDQYGVFVRGMSVGTIKIEETDNVEKAYFAALGAEWRSRMIRTEAEAEGAAFSARARHHTEGMQALTRTFEDFRNRLLNLPEPASPLAKDIVDRYMQLIEQLLLNASRDRTTARNYLETMEALARVSPNTIIAAGMDIANMSEFIAPQLKPPPERDSTGKPKH